MHRAPLVGMLFVMSAALAAPSASAQTYTGPTPPPPAPPSQSPPPPALSPTKISVVRASTIGGVLDVLMPISARASGNVNVEYHAARQRNRFTAPVDSEGGHVRFRRVLPPAQANLGTGILTIIYPGDEDTRPQAVRQRAARNPANLDLERPRLVGNRIQASGVVNPAARGVIRLQLEYQFVGAVRVLRFRGTIAGGRWSIDAPLSPAAMAEIALRTGTLQSYTAFTGYFPERIRGEMRAFEVLPTR